MVDNVNYPEHYKKNSVNISLEPIALCECFSFSLGNAIKYIIRYKDKGNPKEDLQKAIWYLQQTILNQKIEHSAPYWLMEAFSDKHPLLVSLFSHYEISYKNIDNCIEDITKELGVLSE